jgi:hypothetical protein
MLDIHLVLVTLHMEFTIGIEQEKKNGYTEYNI